MNEKRALKQVSSLFQEEELLQLLQEMIKIPSHKHVEWQEERLAHFIFEFLTREGIKDVQLEYIQENRPNIIACIPGGNGPSLLLNGHLDTIPPYNMVVPPYQPLIKDKYMSGLGAVDMKGSLAAMVLALAIIKRAGLELGGDLYFTGVIDQEQRSLGTVDLVRQRFNVDYAIVGEPTDLQICVAHKGMEWMKVLVRGKSAHGSTPDKGNNPIYPACRVAVEVEKLNEKLQKKLHPLVGSPSINVGVIAGGDDPNIVPLVCFLEMDRRWTPEESREDIYQEIKRLLAYLRLDNLDFQYELIPMVDRVCPLGNMPLDVDPNNLLVQTLQKHMEEITGQQAKPTLFRAWSDAAILHRELGITAVVFGPGPPERAHAADEAIEIDHLITAIKVYLGAIIGICGVN